MVALDIECERHYLWAYTVGVRQVRPGVIRHAAITLMTVMNFNEL